MNKALLLTLVVLIIGCVSTQSTLNNNQTISSNSTINNTKTNNTVNNQTIQNATINTNSNTLMNYTFYVTIPNGTPINDSINITFFSDTTWQLWKPMTKINNTTWMYTMPASWLPAKATRISYGYSRNADSSKTELIDYNNASLWINRSFDSNRNSGTEFHDAIKSWKEDVYNYVFYVTVPDNTPSNEPIGITFFSDVDWQLWKIMTKVNNNTWKFSMPAGWLPEGATIIHYGYNRNATDSKTELINYDTNIFWANRSFKSNRKIGLLANDKVQSWEDIINITPNDIIKSEISAIVPSTTTSVTLSINGASHDLIKAKDFYYAINITDYYNTSFTLSAYNNSGLINQNNFTLDRYVYAYVSEPGTGRELLKGHAFSGCRNCVPFTNEDYLPFVNDSYDLMKKEGATWVSFNPFWFVTNIYTSDIRPIYRDEYNNNTWTGWMTYTISDNEVRNLIKWAHDRELKVFLMPHLMTINWSETVPGKGNLAPANVNAFFENYTNFQLHYARIAQEEGVELYSIGNEIDSITDPSNTISTGYDKNAKWHDVISTIRGVYHGNLTYSCSCSHNDANPCTPENIPFWDALDVIGFEWYLPLTSKTEVTLNELITDAQDIINSKIKPLSTKYDGKPVLFTEYGWSAKPYAWTSTYTGGSQGSYDKYAAVLAYEAVYQAIRNEPTVMGMFDAWPLGYSTNIDSWIKDYNGPDLRDSIIEPEIAKWYTHYQ